MGGLTAIREALAENLAAIPNVQTSARILANPTPPTLYVLPGDIDYDKTFQRGHDDQFVLVQALVGTPSDIGAQLRMDEFLEPSGPSSVKQAAEADPTLGGLVDDLRVETCTGYRVATDASGRQVLTAEWRVYVMAPGA